MISVLGIPSLNNRHHDVQYRPGGIEKEERRNGVFVPSQWLEANGKLG